MKQGIVVCLLFLAIGIVAWKLNIINNNINFPYNLLGQWSISYQKQDYNYLNSYIKIYPTKIQISTRKELLGGICTQQKEFYGKYTLYSELETQKTKININLEKEINVIKSLFGISLGSKMSKNSELKKSINPFIQIKEENIPLEIEVLSISNTIIILLITGSIYKYSFYKAQKIMG